MEKKVNAQALVRILKVSDSKIGTYAPRKIYVGKNHLSIEDARITTVRFSMRRI